MPAVLFDLDGVVYEGERPIPGAAEAVAWFQDRSIPHLFLTNTTSRSRAALVEKLARFGIATDASRILTPAAAALVWLQTRIKGKVALFVPPATRAELAPVPALADDAETGAAAVVIGDLGEAWDFATLNRAFRLLMTDPAPTLVALGMTRFWKAEDGMRLDAGPFVAALEFATSAEPVVLGKPAAPFFQAALETLSVPATGVVMIGDDIRNDVEAAKKLGLGGVLVRTGKFRPGDLALGVECDAVLDSVADLPGWWMGRF